MQNENGSGQRVTIIRPVMTTVPTETRVYRSRAEAIKEYGGDVRSWVPQAEGSYWENAEPPRWNRDSKEYWAMEELALRGSRDQNSAKAVGNQTPKVVPGSQQSPKISTSGKQGA